MLPVECVVRGYLSGSGWKDYQATGSVCGHALPAGLRESDRLPEPIFTPATKAERGPRREHHRGAGRRARRRRAPTRAAREAALAALRASPPAHAEARGIILADTKFEFGVDPDGVVSSATRRSRPTPRASGRPTATSPARPQPSFDKQYVRDFCLATGWDHTSPGPELPDDVVAGTRARYVEAFERLTGIPFERYLSDPKVVL